MPEDFDQAVRFSRNLQLYDETPIATTEEELIEVIKIIKKRRTMISQAYNGVDKNSDVEKIY